MKRPNTSKIRQRGARDVGRAAAPTVEDVASHAGVSTATVSRCLNAPQVVSAKTRERVMKAVRDLGYAPNFGARVLAAKRTNTFGAIIPTMENAVFARGIQAFQEELGRHGITLLVASSSYRPDLEAEQVATLIARGADALLLIGHDREPATYQLLEQRGVPYVVAWATQSDLGRASIGFDNQASMEAMTREVLARGHRNLGLISGMQKGNDRARARVCGVIAAMAEQGLPKDALTMIETPYSIANGANGFAELMRLSPRPTVVICGNDVLAAGALSKAYEMGLKVPRDVSVTGFDDIEIAQITAPALTTVQVPHKEMGVGAAQILLAAQNGATWNGVQSLPAKVVLRGSLGPAPK